MTGIYTVAESAAIIRWRECSNTILNEEKSHAPWCL
jgi:hypothetical protein